MGYYCNVTINCGEELYNRLKELWIDKDFPKPDTILRADDDFYIQWFDVKWYSDFLADDRSPDTVISEVLDDLDYVDVEKSPGLGYGICVIGEDLADIEFRQNDYDRRIDVIREALIPQNGETIPVD